MPVEQPEKKKLRGICTGFIYNEDGVIEVSLKHITIISCATTSLALFIMLYLACVDQSVKCNWELRRFPMVSDVICLPFFDRIWCIASTIFALTCM